MSASEEFTILRLSFPADAREILRINYQDFRMNTSNPIAEEEFIATGLDGGLMVAKLSAPGNVGWKLVQSSSPSNILSWIMFCPPQPLDERTEEEQIRDLRKEIDGAKSSRSKESMFKMRMEYRVLNERFLGKGYQSRFWELWGLATDEKWQRGMAGMLVEFGMSKIEEMVRENEGVDGVYVTASLAGQRTYEKAGFEMIGKDGGSADEPEGLSHVWFVKKFV
ncbi:hypothetical protein BKA64DRAFT_651104 [Cadophora sp. MPI-SDFR-AT-0126]|nr:hypothetical protein BKA64DRAFT_651104 [Leotiomycetes sp. MPI-SDFR-AT-0126]